MTSYRTKEEVEKEFDELWKRMRDNGFGKKVSLDGRMIWSVGDGHEDAFTYADDTIKRFNEHLRLSDLESIEEGVRHLQADPLKDSDDFIDGFATAKGLVLSYLKSLKQ